MDKSKVVKADKKQTVKKADDADMKPDWSHGCENCGARPIVPVTGMCGPCTFGDASTAGGNW